jgi:AraC family transcriptional regulator, transcriptional activator of pobA
LKPLRIGLIFFTSGAFKGFKAYKTEFGLTPALSYKRRDFYKLCLITTNSKFYYGEEEIEIDGSILFFASPKAMYTWESTSQVQSGYSCVFTEEFLGRHPRLAIFLQSPIVALGNIALCPLNGEQKKHITTIFAQIYSAQYSDYFFRHELINNGLQVLIHEALKMLHWENN